MVLGNKRECMKIEDQCKPDMAIGYQSLQHELVLQQHWETEFRAWGNEGKDHMYIKTKKKNCIMIYDDENCHHVDNLKKKS